MKSRRYRQLVKNPIVRLLRPIFRFFYRLFAPKRSQFRSRPDSATFGEYPEQTSESPEVTAIETLDLEAPVVKRPPTVGEMLDRIDWQFTPGVTIKSTDFKSSLASVAPSRPATAKATRQGAAIPNNSVKPTANTTRLVAAERNSARTMSVGELFASVKWQQRQIKVERSTQPRSNFDPSRN